MGNNKAPKSPARLAEKMRLYFIGYEDRGLPSMNKFALGIGITLEELESYRENEEFDRIYRECQQIRRDYLIDRGLDKRFDGSFVKFLLSFEQESLRDEKLTLHLEVIE